MAIPRETTPRAACNTPRPAVHRLGNVVAADGSLGVGRFVLMRAEDEASREAEASRAGAARLSRAQFDGLFRESFASLWLLAAGLVHRRSDADDVVQEAALQAARRLDEFTPGSNFRAWMAQIVRYVCANKNRLRRADQVRGGGLPTPEPAARPGVGDRVSVTIDRHGALLPTQPELDDQMVRALAELDATARACLLLRCVGGLSFREVSALLEIPEGTAMSHVFRSRAALARTLRPPAPPAHAPPPAPPQPPGPNA